MKMKIEESEFQGKPYKQLYLVLENGDEYLIGTLKTRKIVKDDKVVNINYINCVHKEYKKN